MRKPSDCLIPSKAVHGLCGWRRCATQRQGDGILAERRVTNRTLGRVSRFGVGHCLTNIHQRSRGDMGSVVGRVGFDV